MYELIKVGIVRSLLIDRNSAAKVKIFSEDYDPPPLQKNADITIYMAKNRKRFPIF